jgi:cAMP-dependent protein kinase regulator
MGCSASKDGSGGVASNSPETGEFSGHEPLFDDTDRGAKRYLTSLSPSVTLQALLQRPNLNDMKSVGNKVVKEVKTRVVHDSVHHLRNVFARPLERAFAEELPVYKKDEDEKEWLENALKSNFVFESLPHAQVFLIVQALEHIQVPQRTTLITAGEPGDYFYVLKTGEVEFTNPARGDGVVLGQAGPGDSFGELALLYDAPRAATVTTLSDCELYRVGQVVFRRALQNVAIETADEKVALLKTVAFLQGVSNSDLQKLASVMTPRPFSAGELLIEKGKTADAFWLLYKGTRVWLVTRFFASRL